MSLAVEDTSKEKAFQQDIIQQLEAEGWLLGDSKHYNRERALYEEDLLGFVQSTQEAQWEKYCKLYPKDTEETFCKRVVAQLSKADLDASPKAMQAYGTLGVLRHGVRDRGTRFKLCQFKPEHELNPDTLARWCLN